jgi:hypothetical protein
MSDKTDNELLVDLRAKRDWLRHNPGGMAAQTTKRAIRALERELESRGVDCAAPQSATGRTRLSLSVWYVAVNDGDKPGQCIHADPECLHLTATRSANIREATESEIERLDICSTCG